MQDWSYQTRREFLRYALGTAAVAYGSSAFGGIGSVLERKGVTKLTILYTNDQHSRIEPFPENDPRYGGEGGFAKRAALIEKIRQEEEHVLLLDAGDIFQGTPYFNYFSGEVEYKLMSLMKYDATTFGNHDFDLGCENIVKQLPHAEFDFINCNYDFKDTALADHKKVAPYRIYRKGKLKIGVLGLGIELENLVDKKYVKGIIYHDPVERAKKYAKILKRDAKCDYVICLSHLGFKYEDNKISDVALAAQTSDIDLIIGGHTHTFLGQPVEVQNSEGKQVYVTQVGWAGIWLGKTDVFFSHENRKVTQQSDNKKVL